MLDWIPIDDERKPIDEQLILVCYIDEGEQCITTWIYEPAFAWQGFELDHDTLPTHWATIPNYPNEVTQ